MCSELDQATYYKDDLVRQESRSSVYFMFISFFIFSFFFIDLRSTITGRINCRQPKRVPNVILFENIHKARRNYRCSLERDQKVGEKVTVEVLDEMNRECSIFGQTPREADFV